MPGLLGLPRHFLNKLSPRARRISLGIAAVLLAAAIVAAILLAPRISESKRERAAEERRAQAEALERERVRLTAEQRPRRGTLQAGAPAGLVAGVEQAITRDAVARARSGELDNPARHTNCRALGRDGSRLLLACTAVTSQTEGSENVSGVTVGYPYRAAIVPGSGRYSFCKTSGRPGEGSYTRRPPVALPRECGG
jgi:hypothetical protein